MRFIAILLCSVLLQGCLGEDKGDFTVGEFKKIYDPSVGESSQWYINDHAVVRGPDDLWHMIGITHAEPADATDEDNFAHATSPTLTAPNWTKQPFAMTVDPSQGETHLWAPYIMKVGGMYYMYYCAGGETNSTYRIHLAFSQDLFNWTRYDRNPLFIDGFDARDPFVMRVKNEWVMYYTATTSPQGGNYIVAYRTSQDLKNWSEKKIAYMDSAKGKWGGPTESPFVVRRGKYYFLFAGPRGDYTTTTVFKSKDPFHWKWEDKVGTFKSHAPELVQDLDDSWYVTSAGWGAGGLYLAPFTWLTGN